MKREVPSKIMLFLSPFIAVLFALFIGSVLCRWIGLNPVQVFSAMVKGIIKSKSSTAEILLKLSPWISLGIDTFAKSRNVDAKSRFSTIASDVLEGFIAFG